MLTVLRNKLKIAEINALWLSPIEIWGARFTSIFSIFSVMTRWIAEMLFMLFFAYIAVQWTEQTKYEVYRPVGAPIINP